MGYHDRADDNNYSQTLKARAVPHPYVRLRTHEDTSFAANIATHAAPQRPHKRLRSIAVPEAASLPDGTPVICVRNPRPDWSAGTAVIVTADGKFVGPVHRDDAQDLSQSVDRGPIPGTITQGKYNVDLEVEG